MQDIKQFNKWQFRYGLTPAKNPSEGFGVVGPKCTANSCGYECDLMQRNTGLIAHLTETAVTLDSTAFG
jgi:hypothetical protein